MSTSPPSSCLETPMSGGRSFRVRKPVKHFGSFFDSEDVISGAEGEDKIQDEEDESFEAKGVKEESDDELAVGDGSEDETNLSKPKKAAPAKTAAPAKKGKNEKVKEVAKKGKGSVKTPAKPVKPIILPKGPKKLVRDDEDGSVASSSPTKAKRASSSLEQPSSRLIRSRQPTVTKKAPLKRVAPSTSLGDESGDETDSGEASDDDDGSPPKKTKVSPVKAAATAKIGTAAKQPIVIGGSKKKSGFTPLAIKSAPSSGKTFVPLVSKSLTPAGKNGKGVATKSVNKAVVKKAKEDQVDEENGEDDRQTEGEDDGKEETAKASAAKKPARVTAKKSTKDQPAKIGAVKKAKLAEEEEEMEDAEKEREEDEAEEEVDVIQPAKPVPKAASKAVKKTVTPTSGSVKKTPRSDIGSDTEKNGKMTDTPISPSQQMQASFQGSQVEAEIPLAPRLVNRSNPPPPTPAEIASDVEAQDERESTTSSANGSEPADRDEPSKDSQQADDVLASQAPQLIVLGELDDLESLCGKNLDGDEPMVDSQDDSTAPTQAAKQIKRKQFSEGSTPPAKKKQAPVDKVSPAHRVAILAALVEPSFLKHVDFGKIAAPFSALGSTSAKLCRHWREVLSSDLKDFFATGSEKKAGKGSINADQKRAIWTGVLNKADKADWKALEEGTGVSATKLKRHLKGSMRTEGEKFIGK